MKKKLLAILLTVCMVLSMAPAALAADSVFTDVNAGDWFSEEVKYVYDNGLMNGVGDNAFDPSGTVTRAMVWTTLARLDGVNTVGSDPWWLAGQKWAMENEISDGTMATENITREQLVTMIWRYAKYIDMDVSEGEDTNILSYTDALDVNEWAISAMQWACAVGIINGIDGALQPQGNATRAQLAAILYRFVEEVVSAVPATHTVTFMWNYGNKGVYETVKVEEGETVGSLKNPSRSGYSFSGWYTEGGDRFTLNTKVTEDIVVYATWSEYVYIPPVHTHAYDQNDTEAGYHKCGTCSYTELCVPKAENETAVICAVCGADYVVAAEATFEIENVTIKNDGAGLESYGTVALKDVTMEAGSPADYAVIIRDGAATLENVTLDSAGGGVGAAGGAKVIFDGGSVVVNTESTSGRYNFYAEGDGTEITIKSGDFSFSKTLNQKRAYIYAGAGTTVKVEGGNFGPASKRDGYTAGIMGNGTVIITGGIFGFDPSTWVAEGYYAAKEGDVWIVKQCASHAFTTEAGYHKCDNCSFTEMCTPKTTDGDAVVCDVCGKDYIVAAEATFELENITIKSDGAGVESYGTVVLKDVTMEAGSPADYAVIIREGTATLENATLDSAGGGVGVVDGAKVVFDGGSMAVNTTSTSGRYNFYVAGEGTELTIKSGDFSFSKTLNQKRAYIYAGAGATVKVEGGNFGPASKRDGYTAGIMGNGTVIITGGTFGFDPTNWVAPGYTAVKSGDIWTVSPVMMKAPLRGSAANSLSTAPQIVNDPDIPDVAVIGETGYDTLQDAIVAATDGNVITLVADVSVDETDVVTLDNTYNTFFKAEGKTITIDLNGKTVSGTAPTEKKGNMGLVGIFSTENNGHLTLKDSVGTAEVEVTTTTLPAYSLIANYEAGCTITIDGGRYSLDTASDSLLYTSPSDALVINGGTFILENVGTGTNGKPWIFNALGSNSNYALVNGGSYNSDVSKQFWVGEVKLADGMIVQKKDDGLYHVICPVLSITNQSGEAVYFDTMTDAITAAQDGDTIVLAQDIAVDETVAADLGIAKLNSDIPTDQHVTLFNVTGKSITVDLNGNKIYADVTDLPDGYSLAGIFSTRNGGHLTLKDSVGTGVVEVNAVEGDDCVNVFAMIINLDDTSSIVIESGTYILDRSVSAMIDTRSNEGVTVNGGTFVLDNVFDPGLKNGQAWTFNAKGQNTRHVVVTGGTFPADIQHQYYPFEVSMAKELALKYDPNTEMYTVVPAVAYVNEQEFSGRWYTNEVGYATLSEAFAAVEGPKTSWDGQVSAQEYVIPLTEGIEVNENGTITITGDNTVFDLGGETLTFTTTNAITVNAENVVIDGTAPGSGITVNAPAGEKATIINVESGSCSVNGGTYTANTSGAGTVSNYAPAVYTKAGTTLNVNDATILATDNGEKGFAVSIQAMGDAVIKNSTVIAEANYKGNAAGNNYGSSSRGIYSEGDLELYECTVWGAHSGVTTKGSVYVDGGTYEGYGHGGFYLAGGSKTSHFYNATISWAPMREGFEADTVAGTNGAGMYISQANNVKAYFDSCQFNMNEDNASQKWDGDNCPLYAVVINYGNNEVYVSNCHIEYASRVAFRLHKTYEDRYVYYGVGNTYDETNVNLLITSGKESQLIETTDSYAKN